jgi:hypothetical protein
MRERAIVSPFSIGATASHASLVISHSSVKGLSDARRTTWGVVDNSVTTFLSALLFAIKLFLQSKLNFFDDTLCTIGANACDFNNMAAANANARIDGILSINLVAANVR